jgi:uncharacterized membrane protein YoaK (UPF0700 family)
MIAGSRPSSTPQVPRPVPALLAFVAGAVDGCTFLALFGLFVAQLTGSFVTIGVQVVKREPTAVIYLLALPVFFVAGVAIVLLSRLLAKAGLARRGLAVALAIEAALLAGLLAAGLATAPFADANAPSAILASALGLAAMGVQSAAIKLMLPGVASTNVMTVNTTQLAIDVAQWLLAARDTAAAEARAAAARRVAALAPVMAGFFAGTVLGALGFVEAGFWSLLPLVVVVAALALWALRAGMEL